MTKKNLANEIPLTSPYVIHLETTNICNFKCRFCPESYEDYEEITEGWKIMKYDMFEYIINNIKNSFGKVNVLRLWIMGEPLLNREIFKMIKYAKETSVADKIELTTNGSLLTHKNRIDLVKSGLDLCKISIYGKTKEEMKQSSQTNVTPEHILSCIKELDLLRKQKNSDMKVMAKTIANKDDAEAYKYMEQISRFTDYIEINGIHSWTSSKDNFSKREGEQIINKEKEVCAFPFYTLAIHVDGNVSPCCVDWRKEEILGNIKESNLKEIWNGEKAEKLRKSHIIRQLEEHSGCKSCNYFIENCAENIDSLTIKDY